MVKPIWTPSFNSEDVKIKEDNLSYSGFFKLKRIGLTHKCFSGEWSPLLIREQIRRADAAAVILFDPKAGNLVLVEQFRSGILNVYDHSPWLLEVVAGLLEPGEDPENTVLREAKEEAGCEILQLLKIGEYYTTPGGVAEKTTLFCGIVDSLGVGGIYGMGDEHEDIKVHVLPAQAVLDMFKTGKLLTSSSTVIALQWLMINIEMVDKLFDAT